MSIYAISDIHLSLDRDKPMHIFGEAWRDHHLRIAENWDAVVKPEDTVLVCGDTSWALRLEQARLDLEWLARRPGFKIVIRGNHDYWWRRESTNRMQREAHDGVHLMHGRAIEVEGWWITGTRGWRVELEEDPDAGDEKVMRRELMYLQRGLSEIPPEAERKLVMLHYPPFDADLEPNEFADVLQAHRVKRLVYGHIHTGFYLEGDVDGIDYRLVSVDHAHFRPVLIV